MPLKDYLLWILVAFIGLWLLKFILRFVFGKKNAQQANPQNELLKKQTQGRLGRDAKTEDQLVQQLRNTKNDAARKKLLEQAAKVARDEEIAAQKGA